MVRVVRFGHPSQLWQAVGLSGYVFLKGDDKIGRGFWQIDMAVRELRKLALAGEISDREAEPLLKVLIDHPDLPAGQAEFVERVLSAEVTEPTRSIRVESCECGAPILHVRVLVDELLISEQITSVPGAFSLANQYVRLGMMTANDGVVLVQQVAAAGLPITHGKLVESLDALSLSTELEHTAQLLMLYGMKAYSGNQLLNVVRMHMGDRYAQDLAELTSSERK